MDTQLKLPVKFIGVGLTVLLLVVVVSISLLSRRSDPKPTPSSKLNPTPTSIVPTLVYPTPVDYSSLSEQEKQASYLQRELIANELDNKIQTSYPWLNKLPIQTPEYFLFFDVRKAQFFVYVYAQPNQLEQVKTDVQQQLQAQSIPVDQYEINYIQQ